MPEGEDSTSGAVDEDFVDEVHLAEHGSAATEADGAARKGGEGCHKGCFVWLVVTLVIITGVTIALVATLPNSSKKESSVPVPAPTQAPAIPLTPTQTANRDSFLKALTFEWSGEDVNTDGTAASKALEWLTDTDPQQLTQSTDFLVIKQRYVAAVIYYSLAGESWNGRRSLESLSGNIAGSRSELHRRLQLLGFLSAADVCDWNDGPHGIFCDTDGNVVELKFRT